MNNIIHSSLTELLIQVFSKCFTHRKFLKKILLIVLLISIALVLIFLSAKMVTRERGDFFLLVYHSLITGENIMGNVYPK